MARKAKLVNCAAIQIVEGKTLVLCRGKMKKCLHSFFLLRDALHSNENCFYRKARRGKAEGFLCESWNAKKELFEQLQYEMEQEE